LTIGSDYFWKCSVHNLRSGGWGCISMVIASRQDRYSTNRWNSN